MTFLFKAIKGTMDFGSEYNELRLKDTLKKNEGAVFEIKKRSSRVSDEMRGYYYGALIPFMRSLIPQWQELDEDQIHEALKKNFNYFECFNPVTNRVERYGQSAMAAGQSNQRAMEYIMRISDWVRENYDQTTPDPEEYKRWRDTSDIPTFDEYAKRKL
jgi:hypothetical protein